MRDFWVGLSLALTLAGMAFGASGCATTSSRLKARFAREQSCSVDQVGVTDEGGEVYLASGCGKSSEYICPSFAGMGDSSTNCHERGLNPREPTGNPPPQNTSRPDLVGPK
ncbi:MAG TPA: hypothetical protein VGF76_21595 [Polyangiaceae bacterium]|jgi:hypothetical protein